MIVAKLHLQLFLRY